MRAGLALIALIVGLWSAPPAIASGPVAAPVVVNELLAGKFVELRNVSESTQDIGGYNLWLCSNTGVARTLRIAFGAQLAPDDFYLVATASYTGGIADQTYPDRLPGGGAVLLDRDYGWVDGVAVVPGSPCGTGGPAPICPNATTARSADSHNTGDNAIDFACRTPTAGEPN